MCECGGVAGIGSKSMCVFERRVMSTASRSFLSALRVKELFSLSSKRVSEKASVLRIASIVTSRLSKRHVSHTLNLQRPL